MRWIMKKVDFTIRNGRKAKGNASTQTSKAQICTCVGSGRLKP